MTYISVVVFLLETSSRQQRTHDCKQIQSAYDIKKDLDFFCSIFTPSDRALNTDRALFKSLTLSDTATATGTADFTTDTVT